MGFGGHQLVPQKHGGLSSAGFGALAGDFCNTTEGCIKIVVGLLRDTIIIAPTAVASIDLGGAQFCVGNLNQRILYKLSNS